MKTVCIESPLAGDIERNKRYARACMLFCLRRGVAPFVSHLLYTQVLDDRDPEDRKRGMKAGFEIGDQCDERWLFTDLGESSGMKAGRTRAAKRGQPVFAKTLGSEWAELYGQDATPTEEFDGDCEDCSGEASPRVSADDLGLAPDAPLEIE